MKTETYTPGPWICDDRHIHPDNGRLTYPIGEPTETDVIVLVDTDQHPNGLLTETDKANLRLIAAAPTLAALADNVFRRGLCGFEKLTKAKAIALLEQFAKQAAEALKLAGL